MCKNINLTVSELRVVGDYYDSFIPVEDQTTFSLTKATLTDQEINRSRVFINGHHLALDIDYVINSGNQLDITNYSVSLDSNDYVEIYY
jgi:hypothetical protein